MKLVKIFLMSLVMMGHALAETITFDGIVDLTPGQAYTKAGGGLLVVVSIGASIRQQGFKVNAVNGDFNFGEETVAKVEIKSTYESKEVFNSSEQVDINVRSSTLKIARGSNASLEFTRDPKNPSDHRIRIEVVDFTPGVDGNPGKIKINLKEI